MANNKIKTHKMVSHIDGEGFDPVKVMHLEGYCKKCKEGGGNNALIIYDFISNKVNKQQSLFRTLCLVCKSKSIIYLNNVDNEETK